MARKDVRTESWHAKGHDYPANFTVNICAPVIEEVTDVVGVEQSRWKNVSAYYELDGNIYSIGYAGMRHCFQFVLEVFYLYRWAIRGSSYSSDTGNKPPNPSSGAGNSS